MKNCCTWCSKHFQCIHLIQNTLHRPQPGAHASIDVRMTMSIMQLALVFALYPLIVNASLAWNVVDVDNLIQSHEGLRASLPSNVCDFDLPTATTLPGDKYIGGQPVYLSIATISFRIHEVHEIVCKFLSANVYPTHIYIMVSEDKFLLDQGVLPHNIPPSLVSIARAYPSLVSIVYTENIGPHRKLLPILKRYWEDPNSVIITFDDDFKNNFSFETSVQELLKYYVASQRQSVVALRTRRMGLCGDVYHNERHSWHSSNANENNISVSLYKGWNCCNMPGNREILVLPTGVGGVLYRPSFFHPIIFDPKFRIITATNDDLMFRLGTLVQNVDVVTACRQIRHKKNSKVHQDCPRHVANIPELAYKTARRPSSHPIVASGYIRGSSGGARKLMGVGGDGKNKEASAPLEGQSLWDTLNSMESRLHDSLQALPEGNLLVDKSNKMLNNDLMWHAAITYLKSHKVMDFDTDILYPYAIHERFDCFEHLAGEIGSGVNRRNMLHKNCSVHFCGKKYTSTGEVNLRNKMM